MGPVRWKIKEHVVRSPRLPNDLESEMSTLNLCYCGTAVNHGYIGTLISTYKSKLTKFRLTKFKFTKFNQYSQSQLTVLAPQSQT